MTGIFNIVLYLSFILLRSILLSAGSFGCSFPAILQEIAKEDEEKQKKHLRRVIAKQERLKACPPRLGKYKYASAFIRSSH